LTNQRYYVVLLMFVSVFVNYMDRVNFSVSIPSIRHQFGFDLNQIGSILFVWGIIYAAFNFPGGWLIDRLGLRWALPLTLGWWSIFTIATPFARSLSGWYVIRGLMGAGEAPIWPINAKLANTWVSIKERSTLYTLAGSGQYLGPFVGAFLATWILFKFGWQWTFIDFGILGLLILPVWILVVRDRPALSPHVNAQEIAHIGNHAKVDEKADWVGIRSVFFSRTGVGLLLIYLTFGYVLFTFLNWMPSYMYYTFHFSIVKAGWWSGVSYGMGFLGFVLSGPFNDYLARRFDRLTARRIGTAVPMGAGAICVVLSMAGVHAGFAGPTAVLLGLAQLFMNMTVGAWAVSVIDVSPNQASTGLVYGVYNGVLNIVGAFSSLILAAIATAHGFPAAFGSAIVFMLVFIAAMLFVVDRPSYERLVAHAELSRGTAS